MQLLDNRYGITQKYIWVTFNISKITALVKVFILADGQVYNLFL